MSALLQRRLVARLGELPIKRLVAVMLVLTLGPLALLAYLTVTLATDAVTREIEARVRSTSGVAASLISDRFGNLVELVDSYADRPSLIEAMQGKGKESRASIRVHLRNLREREGIATAFLADPQGILTDILPKTPGIIGDDFSHRDWYRGVTETGRPYVSEVYRTAATGTPLVVAAASPLHASGSGRVVGILAAAYDVSTIQRLTDELERAEKTVLTVTDQSGVIVAGSGIGPTGITSERENPSVAAALAGRSGVRLDDGVLVAYSPVPSIGFTVTAEVPSATAFEAVGVLRTAVLSTAALLAMVLMAGLSVLVLALRGRRTLLDEMQMAKDSAEGANRAKSNFLSRTSHELRTPLNGILGFAQLLEMEDLDEEQRDDVGEILKAGRHLLSLINEVLDIAGIESGRMTLSMEPVPISSVIAESLQMLAPAAAERGITFLGEPVPEDIYALADYQRLKQVLLNLGSNAIKYNEENGTVSVVCSFVDDEVAIVVADTGPGLPPDKVERLFEPFDRLGAEGSEVEGTGLGLALAKNLMEAMDGSISVESEVGAGSRFAVKLRAVGPPTANIAGRLEPLSSSGRAAAVSGGRPRTILYIDDDRSDLKIVDSVLGRRPGTILLTAMQGSTGFDLARHHRPDLILLDVQLPDVSGRKVLDRLKAEETTRCIPVIVLSGDASTSQQRSILHAGAELYLTKPIEIDMFLEAIDRVLAPKAPARSA